MLASKGIKARLYRAVHGLTLPNVNVLALASGNISCGIMRAAEDYCMPIQ